MRKEQTFCTEIINSFEQKGIWAYKIPDMPRFKGQKTRFSIKKPFDIIVDYYSRFMAIECKFSRGFKAMNISQFEKKNNNQIDNLLQHNLCYIFLNIFIPREINRLLIFDREAIGDLVLKKRYTKKELEAWPKYIDGRQGLYYLSEFF